MQLADKRSSTTTNSSVQQSESSAPLHKIRKSDIKLADYMHSHQTGGGAICQSHNKTFEVYCWTDKMPLCIECLIANHKTHEVHSIQATLERLRGRLTEASSSLT